LAEEAENLLAAHRRALVRGPGGAELAIAMSLALDPLLAASGPGSMRLAILDAALAAATKEEVAVELRIRALEARSDTHRMAGQASEAVADAQAALGLASSRGEHEAVGRVERALATLSLVQGHLPEGRGLAERAIAASRRAGQRGEEARALGLLGSIEALEGELAAAASTLERAIALHRALGDLRFEAANTGDLAVVAHEAGRLAQAREHGERALALCLEVGNHRLEGEVLGLLAVVAHENNRLDDARELYGRALLTHVQVGNRRGEGILLGYLGTLLTEVDDFEGARSAFGRALNILRECRDRRSEALALGALAALEAREGCLESARAALTHATECLDGTGDLHPRAAVDVWRGHLEIALAREARAEGDESRWTMLVSAARRRLERFESGPIDALADSDRGSPQVRRAAAAPARSQAADVRFARRALERALAWAEQNEPERPARARRGSEPPPSDASLDAPADALVVCVHGRWFRAPRGVVVSVARWRPLQRLLERLAERREIAPGEPLAVEALVAAGWPGERMLPKAGATRVYTAIASLRRLGLKGTLMKSAGGYLLRPDISISRVSRH
jgi:tetratricopeptide (TPR) repeat protein